MTLTLTVVLLRMMQQQTSGDMAMSLSGKTMWHKVSRRYGTVYIRLYDPKVIRRYDAK